MEANAKEPKPFTPHTSNAEWVPYDVDDRVYFGAARVVEAERDLIRSQRPDPRHENSFTGLALSGGGIRSASFCLGVLQALAYQRWLPKIDYLSTVSGGGYIGSSVSWLLHKTWTVADPSADHDKKRMVQFGVAPEEFPYGTYPMSGTLNEPEKETEPPGGMRRRDKGSMLRFVRQNAKYLVPGHGINILSLIAAVVRGALVSLTVYLGLLTLVFLGLHRIGFYDVARLPWLPALEGLAAGTSWPLFLAALFGAAFLLLVFLYTALSWVPSSYRGRRFFDVGANYLLTVALAFLVLSAPPWVQHGIAWVTQRLAPGQAAGAAESLTEWLGAVSALLGALSAFGAFARSSRKKGVIPIGLLATIAAALLLFGLLLLGYRFSLRWYQALGAEVGTASVVIAIVAIAGLGLLANLNRVSIHRFYRDRLMEAFLPDVDNALQPTGHRPYAREADRKKLSALANQLRGPYHIVNANVVLVGSKRAKFKGRGGDNFILSPLYCGSNATGWRDTEKYANDDMTLASAMAISGAAVNPSAGCGGEGVTRNTLMSMLMGLLNLRLGYWSLNPALKKLPWPIGEPNHWTPGLWELVNRSRLCEDRRFLQLSDGGHFENLGLYELVRRKLKVIIVCDGAADPNYSFSDLANAIEKIRVDFGALVSIDSAALQRLVPRPKDEDSDDPEAERFAKTGYLITDLIYEDNTRGRLIYLTTTFFERLSADLYGYRREHPEFPDEPTSDQFFDEKQFEAYRELGYSIALEMMCDPAVGKDPVIADFFPFHDEHCRKREELRQKATPPPR